MSMKVGRPGTPGGSLKKIFKIKDGDNIYRILPPLGDLADKGIWSKYHTVVWGYKDSADKVRPFLDCRVVNRKTKMVEIESSAFLRNQALKERLSLINDRVTKGTASAEDLEIKKKLVDLIKQYNIESKHYMNVMNLQGEIGLIKIGHKAKLTLDQVIDQMKNYGINPVDITGMYINFHRSCPTNNFRDTIIQVTPYLENIRINDNGIDRVVQQYKTHTLDEAVINRLATEAFELDKIYISPTSEEIKMMVDQGAPGVDQVFAKHKNNNESNSYSDHDEAGEMAINKQPPITNITSIQQPLAAPQMQQPVVNPTSDLPIVDLLTQITPAASLVAPVATPQVQVEPPVSTPKLTPNSSPAANLNLSDDDFLASLGK